VIENRKITVMYLSREFCFYWVIFQ